LMEELIPPLSQLRHTLTLLTVDHTPELPMFQLKLTLTPLMAELILELLPFHQAHLAHPPSQKFKPSLKMEEHTQLPSQKKPTPTL